jgi:membrane-associated phospholipid phosphatase
VRSSERVRAAVGSLFTPQWRWLAITVYFAALATQVVLWGMPLERMRQTLWLLGALFVFCWGRPWRSQVRILVDWLPFVGFLVLYDFTRGIADKLGRPTHVTEPLNAEKWLFHGVIPSHWLQERFYTPAVIHWWDIVTAVVYTSHFVVVWVVAVVLYVRSRHQWARWTRRILLLSYAGLVTYMLYPAAPPWYASWHGYTPEDIQRIASRGLDGLHLHAAAALVQQGQAQVNDVAALPSLHAAFTALLTVFVWGSLRWWGRGLMVLYTAAMAASLVYGGEHYVFDALVGYVYVAAVVLVAWAWERWRDGRRAGAPPGEAVPAVVAEGIPPEPPTDDVVALPAAQEEDARHG